MKTILCVEDEKLILDNNRVMLTRGGYNVLTAKNLAEARAHLANQTPDAILLDIKLPDGLGLELLEGLRGAGSKIPILLLTARDKSSDIAHGLRLGANDYLSKPFEYEVLLARIEAMFRNMEQVPETLKAGPITLTTASLTAFFNGVDLLLTQKEFALLLLFMQNESRMMDAEYIYEKVWGQPMNEDAKAVKIQVSRLRKKLEGSGCTISSTRGEGYCFGRE